MSREPDRQRVKDAARGNLSVTTPPRKVARAGRLSTRSASFRLEHLEPDGVERLDPVVLRELRAR